MAICRNYVGFYLIVTAMTTILWDAAWSAETPIIYRVTEGARPDYVIGNMKTDAGLTRKYNLTILNTLEFSFLTQTLHRDLFNLGQTTGDLRMAMPLDRDTICPRQKDCRIKLDIAVRPVMYFQAIKVVIVVIDTNDNAPTFPQGKMQSAISESNNPGILFPIPQATDPDSPKYSIQRYEFFPDLSNKFELRIRNSTDGTMDLHLALREMVDREREDFYEMKVVAYDGGTPPRTGSINIEISVVDINDNSPRFLNSSYSVDVPENVPINTTIIRVRAIDPDEGANGEVSYGFSDRTLRADGIQFGINQLTGDIYLRRHLDYERESLYNLAVTAQDQGADSLPTLTKVVIRVVDVNDHAPEITINALTTNDNAQIPEEAEVPYFIAHISVFDPDQGRNGRFICNITDPLFELVQLFDTEFKIMAIDQLDREEQATHNIKLTCSDFGRPPLTSTDYLRVVVVDKNDNGPRFTQHVYFASITENNNIGSHVWKVSAIDQDEGSNADVHYWLDINAREDFKINPSTGEIHTQTKLDREKNNNLEFKVMAADGGIPPQTATATILLNILDVDDNAPKFTQSRYVFSIEERRPANSDVGQVTAVDGDLPPFNEFSFYIPDGQTAAGYFSVDAHSGMITTTRQLDREAKEAYSLNLVVGNKNIYQANDTSVVIVYVDDVNDNAPIIDFPNSNNRTVYISNQVPIGYIVSRVIAHDIDYGRNSTLMYSISEGNDRREFSIGSSTGDIFVNTRFDSKDDKTYKLIIMVKDLGSPQKISIGTLNIVVNESVPYIPMMGGGARGKGISDLQLIIIICVILGTIVVASLLIVAIVVLKRRDNKNTNKTPKYFQRTEAPVPPGEQKDHCDNHKMPNPATTIVLSGPQEGDSLVQAHLSPELDHTVLKADLDDEELSISHTALDASKVRFQY